MNLRILIAGILFGLLTNLSFSQSYTGYLADNYNGVHGVLLNPASISDSKGHPSGTKVVIRILDALKTAV